MLDREHVRLGNGSSSHMGQIESQVSEWRTGSITGVRQSTTELFASNRSRHFFGAFSPTCRARRFYLGGAHYSDRPSQKQLYN